MMIHQALLRDESRAKTLRHELDRIRSILAAHLDILQVLVFGSWTTGCIHAWSDLDLVIVMQSDDPFLTRGATLAKLARPRVGVQFLVYTPQETAECLNRPFFREEILHKGMTMPLHPRTDAKRRLAFAYEDLQMAELAFREDFFNQTCFHAQQCVEKSLKALLARQGELLPRTHALADIWNRLPKAAQDNLENLYPHFLELDQFYIPTRYPDALPGTLPAGTPERPHAESALQTAKQCWERAQRMCQDM